MRFLFAVALGTAAVVRPAQAELKFNPNQVAAFDGANVWVVNDNSNKVTKLRASDGAVLGTFAVGGLP